MQFHVLNTDYITTDIDEVIDYCISEDFHADDEDCFENWVNDTCDGTEIAGVNYSPYEILERFDNLSDVIDSYCQYANEEDADNARYELRHADIGERIYIQAYEVICEEEEPEEEEEFYGGDDRSLEALREVVACEQLALETERRLDEENKNDYLSLFQTIGA